MGFFRNIKTSIDDKSSMSVNSITVLSSALIGLIVGLTICFAIGYDVFYDGKLDSDIDGLAWLLLASGGFVASSGVPKAYVDGKMKTRSWIEGEKIKEENNEEDI